jgi:glutamyl-tRNA(Gln) amidotransferase subunit E
LRRAGKGGKDDAGGSVAGREDDAKAALGSVVDRANQGIKGVPEETRRALPDGNTEFMRPLPGAARMYVETDIPPIIISKEKLKHIKRRLPELPEKKRERFQEEYGLSEELSRRLSISENAGLFEELVREHKIDPTFIASTLEETMVSLRREGVSVDEIGRGDLDDLFGLISKEMLAKEAVPEVLGEVAKGATVKKAIDRLGLGKMSRPELRKIISQIVKKKRRLVEERGKAAIGPLMGVVMGKVRARADGKIVRDLLERELRKFKRKT